MGIFLRDFKKVEVTFDEAFRDFKHMQGLKEVAKRMANQEKEQEVTVRSCGLAHGGRLLCGKSASRCRM